MFSGSVEDIMRNTEAGSMFPRSPAFDAITESVSSECGGNLLSRELGCPKPRVKTFPYSAGSSNPRSRLSVGDWHRISKASRILLLKLSSSLTMTAALFSSKFVFNLQLFCLYYQAKLRNHCNKLNFIIYGQFL